MPLERRRNQPLNMWVNRVLDRFRLRRLVAWANLTPKCTVGKITPSQTQFDTGFKVRWRRWEAK
jgi:hypothetical protein